MNGKPSIVQPEVINPRCREARTVYLRASRVGQKCLVESLVTKQPNHTCRLNIPRTHIGLAADRSEMCLEDWDGDLLPGEFCLFPNAYRTKPCETMRSSIGARWSGRRLNKVQIQQGTCVLLSLV